MTQDFDAIYEHGAFRPLEAIVPQLAEGQQVRMSLQTNASHDTLALAAGVYDGLSERDIDEVEKISLDRTSFFAGPSP